MSRVPAAQDAALARMGFAEPARARVALAALGLWHEDSADDAGAALVVDGLTRSPDPDLALAALERSSSPGLLAALRGSEALRRRLLGVLGASAVLGEHLARHPDDWQALADEELAGSRPTAFGLRHRFLVAVGADPLEDDPVSGMDEAAAHDGLRVAYRSSVLRLAARDVGEGLAVEDVAGELADLAGAALEAGLAIARAGLPADAEPCRLAVVGMGKCGARELNYASDVDVVFVAEAVDGGDEGEALRTATRLAEGLMKACSASTPEGTLWPVDANLRPEGKAGPLVRTLASHEAYYRRWAKTWEFQALLKARPVAGDIALGAAYVEALAPMVWADRPDAVADVQAMKRRVEAGVPKVEVDRQLKLAPGGLRDVEFAVQLLQLVHGRADESLRVRATLEGLGVLAAGGYVAIVDAERLAEAYRFLRTVEHRLQLHKLRRTHTLPTDPHALRRTARSLGLVDADALLAERARHAVEVRRLHEKLFYRPLLTTVARLPADETRLTPQAARTRLEALGFADPAGALRHLEALTSGLSRRAKVLRTMLPVMLPWFAEAHDPDAGLLAFRRVSEALGDTPWFLALLRDSEVEAERLARLLAASAFVADLLTRAPEAAGLLGRDDELVPRTPEALRESFLAVVARRGDAHAAVAAVRGLRRHELLRVACSDLLGRVDTRAVGEALTAVTEATLCAALEAALGVVEETRGALPVRVAVIGVGRLGGREQGYGSDADVLFVHEPADGAEESEAAQVAKLVFEQLRSLLAEPGPDPAVDVDAGLRPEGKQGALSLSLAGYARYHAGRASTWEAQAMLRARFVCGDADIGARFDELLAPVRWPASFSVEQAREIRRIKARVESERMPRGVTPHRHLKLGPGAIADVEWTVQLLQLQHAGAVEGLRTPSTLDALTAAVEADLLPSEDAEVLAEAWTLASAVRNALVLVRGRSADVLPEDVRAGNGVARVLGYPAGGRADFLDAYRRATRRARAVVERVFYE